MRSIRTHLTLTLLTALYILFTISSAALYLFVKGVLVNQFDESLVKKTLAFAGMAEAEDEDGVIRIELEFTEYAIPEFQPSPDAEFYQVWRADGSVFARSPSLGGEDLPRIEFEGEGPSIQDMTLHNGQPGRAAGVWKTPQGESGEDFRGYDSNDPKNRLRIVVAQSKEPLNRALLSILVGFSGAGLLLGFGLIGVVTLSVKRGLTPLDRIANKTAAIDASDLSHRFVTDSLPDELVPVCTRLNDLLDRLDSAFQRERRFNRDVSHELRTPIAELRILADVALSKSSEKWEFDESQEYFRDVLEIARDMESLVVSLLALVRGEGGTTKVEKRKVVLADIIAQAEGPFLPLAHDRNISVEGTIPSDRTVSTDPSLLLGILRNLFSNAVYYTPEGGTITYGLESTDSNSVFSLTNTHHDLTEEDLPHLFEPFWQKDSARSSEDRHGLGLSLVNQFSDLLGLEIETSLPEVGLFVVRITFPATPE